MSVSLYHIFVWLNNSTMCGVPLITNVNYVEHCQLVLAVYIYI